MTDPTIKFVPTRDRVRDRYTQSATGVPAISRSNDPDPGGSFDRWLQRELAFAWKQGYDSGFGDGGVNAWDPANPYAGGSDD